MDEIGSKFGTLHRNSNLLRGIFTIEIQVTVHKGYNRATMQTNM